MSGASCCVGCPASPCSPGEAGTRVAQKCVQPVGAVVRRAVDGDALPVGDRADHRPALGQRAVRERREQRVVVSPAEDERDRVGAQWPPPTACSGSGDLEGVAAYVDRDPGRRRRGGRRRPAARRRRRSSRWRRPRRRPGRRRTAARGGGRPRPAPAASGTRGRGRPARRPPSPGGRSARARRRARRRSGARATAVHDAEDGHRDHDLVGAGQVAADDAGARPGRTRRRTRREVERPLGRQVARAPRARW